MIRTRINRRRLATSLLGFITVLAATSESAAQPEVRQLWAYIDNANYIDETGRVWSTEHKQLVYRHLSDLRAEPKRLLGGGFERSGSSREFSAADRISHKGYAMVVKALANLYSFGEGMRSLTLGPSGFPWITTSIGNILRFDGERWIRVQGSAGRVLFGGDESLWALSEFKQSSGSLRTLKRWTNGAWVNVSKSVVSAAIDDEGSVWAILYDEKGISVASYSSGTWRSYKAPGIPNSAQGIAAGPNGDVWVYARVEGAVPAIYKLDDGSWTLMHTHVPEAGSRGARLQILRNEQIIANGRYLPSTALRSQSFRSGFLDFNFERFGLGIDGSFWGVYQVGGPNNRRWKLVRWREGNEWDVHDVRGRLTGMTVDHDGNAWVSSMGGGVIQFSKNGEVVQRWGQYAQTITMSSAGDIYTTMPEGEGLAVYKWDGRKFVKAVDQLIPMTRPYQFATGYPWIAVDKAGAVWSIRQATSNPKRGIPIKLVAGTWRDQPIPDGGEVRFPSMTSGLDGSVLFATSPPRFLRMQNGNWRVDDVSGQFAMSDQNGVLWYIDRGSVLTAYPDATVVTAEPTKQNSTTSSALTVIAQKPAVQQPDSAEDAVSAKTEIPASVTADTQQSSGVEKPATAPVRDIWEVVGFWDYDQADGQFLAGGVVSRNVPGSRDGVTWAERLELVAHDQLRPRNRQLWPVKLNRASRKVCIGVPYPTFTVHIDLQGTRDDGLYEFSTCFGQ